MAKLAVVKSGGQQFLVKENDEIIVNKLDHDLNKEIELETLAVFDDEGSKLDLGLPLVSKGIKAQILGHIQADKIRISRFKAKVRRRKVTGFRADLTKIRIMSI